MRSSEFLNVGQRLFSKSRIGLCSNENLSVFATYTNSFASNAGYTSDQFNTVNTNQSIPQIQNQLSTLSRQSIKPSTVDQYEIGVKKNFWNNALAVNLTAYQIMYNNYYQTYWFIPTSTPTLPCKFNRYQS
ncbi:TonB-dependent receptor [Chryseobacterium arthrosphaerae]|uniref:TonB-dependent receptor n=1 Tax=Chryseobacterium arthrosphaerae TaxID=651561 RepID=A0A432E1Y8_9FLAO|nr:TonB-dependent receptor [Chryseobacterium arthrosphaerae]